MSFYISDYFLRNFLSLSHIVEEDKMFISLGRWDFSSLGAIVQNTRTVSL